MFSTICVIMVAGIMGNNPVKLFPSWTSGSGGDAVQRKNLWMD